MSRWARRSCPVPPGFPGCSDNVTDRHNAHESAPRHPGRLSMAHSWCRPGMQGAAQPAACAGTQHRASAPLAALPAPGRPADLHGLRRHPVADELSGSQLGSELLPTSKSRLSARRISAGYWSACRRDRGTAIVDATAAAMAKAHHARPQSAPGQRYCHCSPSPEPFAADGLVANRLLGS